ncbi:MAG: DUF262 domain-containing protein [Deltaproteobacteria bacterium]|nr:MAG: DUF262 domain-containing protein [Deltaproteobacteria bacterium]
MQVSTILDHIDSGHMALPEFQRGYVWNREQVRRLFTSLYKRHPVGSLLVWATESSGASHRGDAQLASGIVKLLLDGQQRITSLYGVLRGRPPKFFDGNAQSFTGLYFHLEKEEFEFYQPIKMKDDPLWIGVTALLKNGATGLGNYVAKLSQDPSLVAKVGEYAGRLSTILGISEINLHVEEVTGKEKTIDVVVEIFNAVNSGGTTLSKGDLALAKICAEWPEARDRMKLALAGWAKSDYHFDLDWLLRNINTVITGEAKFQFLHNATKANVEDGLNRSIKTINQVLNMINGRLGLDHDQVLFGKFAIPVMVHYLDRRKAQLDATESDKLLFWFLQSAMWGRFSGSTESVIDQDLAAIEDLNGGLDRLISQLRLWHGGLVTEPGHFAGWSLGARFYPVLYMLTRVGAARDWGTGLPLKSNLLGQMSRLEVHHIFPKAQLYKLGHGRADINAVANFCFLTKLTNLNISDKRPEVYFPQVEKSHPGALASQWIPMDPELWKLENYHAFLTARRELLANAANDFMIDLLHGDDSLMKAPVAVVQIQPAVAVPITVTRIDSENEEEELLALVEWVAEKGLPEGSLLHEIADPVSGESMAIFDLAWPHGLQEGLSQPVAVLLNEEQEVHTLANNQGYRYFTNVQEFKNYVLREVVAEEGELFSALPNDRFDPNSRRYQVWSYIDSKGPATNEQIASGTGIDIATVKDCTKKLCADGKATSSWTDKTLVAKEPSKGWQEIFKVGAEGGAISVMGKRDAGGCWTFALVTDESTLGCLFDEFAGQDLRSSELSDSWEGILKMIDRYPWTKLYPLEPFHEDFKKLIWAAVQVRGTDEHRMGDWARCCGLGSN